MHFFVLIARAPCWRPSLAVWVVQATAQSLPAVTAATRRCHPNGGRAARRRPLSNARPWPRSLGPWKVLGDPILAGTGCAPARPSLNYLVIQGGTFRRPRQFGLLWNSWSPAFGKRCATAETGAVAHLPKRSIYREVQAATAPPPISWNSGPDVSGASKRLAGCTQQLQVDSVHHDPRDVKRRRRLQGNACPPKPRRSILFRPGRRLRGTPSGELPGDVVQQVCCRVSCRVISCTRHLFCSYWRCACAAQHVLHTRRSHLFPNARDPSRSSIFCVDPG